MLPKHVVQQRPLKRPCSEAESGAAPPWKVSPFNGSQGQEEGTMAGLTVSALALSSWHCPSWCQLWRCHNGIVEFSDAAPCCQLGSEPCSCNASGASTLSPLGAPPPSLPPFLLLTPLPHASLLSPLPLFRSAGAAAGDDDEGVTRFDAHGSAPPPPQKILAAYLVRLGLDPARYLSPPRRQPPGTPAAEERESPQETLSLLRLLHRAHACSIPFRSFPLG